MYWYY